ncbi:MAG: nuclear transport factor 2 family protein [Dehalococcoidia bacterium]|nr:nuclear transport factor 2 family protein [Dehalococcoidia bacterium]
MTRYADRIDANDPEGSAACFAEDGLGVYWGDYRGRAAIADRLRGILKQFATTSHHLTNVLITLDGDRATAQSYVYAFHRYQDGGRFMHVWGRWVDELVRRDGSWYFARREVVTVGRINEGNPPNDREGHPGHPGRLPFM